MSTNASDIDVDPDEISSANAAQLQKTLATIVGAELADRDLDTPDDRDPDQADAGLDVQPVRVSLGEIVQSCPVPKQKCRALLADSVAEPGSGITTDDERGVYEIDPTR